MDYQHQKFPSPKLIHPATVIVSGPTGCGKTLLTARLLVESKFEPMPERLIWVYSEMQPLYKQLEELVEIEFIKGFSPDLYESLSPETTNLLVLDDQMSTIADSKQLLDLFTKGSHHRNLTVIFLVQNMYFQGKSMRTATINTQYQIIFKSPRALTQIKRMGYEYFENKNFFPAAFKDATSKPFSYVLLDVHPQSEEDGHVRAPIFDDERNYVYIEA